MMDPILGDFHDAVAQAARHAPSLPFLSNVTGAWITAEEATDPAYWTRHLREAVRFGDCVSTLAADGEWRLVECGPGRQLAGLARGQLARTAPAPLASLPGPADAKSDLEIIYATAGTLWTTGVPLDTEALAEPARRVPLPAYPYERAHHWVDTPVDPELVFPRPPSTGAQPLEDWFSLPAWRQAPVAPASPSVLAGVRCLVFAGPAAQPLLDGLRAAGADVVAVVAGSEYGTAPDGTITLRPAERDDYETLIARTGVPQRIIHAWALDGDPARDAAQTRAAQDVGFFSLLALVQALAAAERDAGVRLDMLTASTQGVIGQDVRRPEHATVAGITGVVPLEARWLAVRHLDLESAASSASTPTPRRACRPLPSRCAPAAAGCAASRRCRSSRRTTRCAGTACTSSPADSAASASPWPRTWPCAPRPGWCCSAAPGCRPARSGTPSTGRRSAPAGPSPRSAGWRRPAPRWSSWPPT